MQTTLAATALLMGLVGGPHCIAMCGAACGGITKATSSSPSAVKKTMPVPLFYGGRLIGYALLGFVAASSVQTLGWLSVHLQALRPLWSMLHLAAIALGFVLLVQAKQPIFLEIAAKRIWRGLGARFQASPIASHRFAPLGLGVLWAFMPCGLLYSAVLIAGLTASGLEGAVVMAAFALGSSVSLIAGPWLWLRLKNTTRTGQWGVRVAGLLLILTSSWALWMGVFHNQLPWCM
jgi:sulfite exporter TauE/SafE